MDYIDPHIHMVSRITDDYETLARMGCVAISEPAFWAGFDRGSVDGFRAIVAGADGFFFLLSFATQARTSLR